MDKTIGANTLGLGVETPKPSPPGRCGAGSRDEGTNNDGTGRGELIADALRSGDKGYAGLSAYTSLNILRSNRLTDEEIEYEVKHLNLLDPTNTFRTRFPSITVKQELLDRTLNSNLPNEIKNIVTNYNNLYLTLSCELKEAQKQVDLLNSYAPDHDHDCATGSLSQDSLSQDTSVSVLNLDFGDISLEDVLNVVNFTDKLTCEREAAYFGTHEYTYGRVRHDPAPYPAHPIFNTIFDQLGKIDSNFTRDNFSCLVTKYKDGKSHILPHSDDENCIYPTSNIYTISFGATRVLSMYTVSGDLQVHDLELKHGMVHAMTCKSQDTWRHAIYPDPNVQDTRVSFTFRHIPDIISTDDIKHNIPNISIPVPQTECSKSKRILLLTDSILSSTPEHIFSSIPGHICVKKVNYQFKDILDFESYFKGTDTVILSCGVNDLARYGQTADSLADTMFPKLAKMCQRHPNTKFVFNSVLHSNYRKNYDWLNNEIDWFNYYMANFCRDIRNMNYFDSHNLLGQSNIRRVWDPKDKNGIHITLDARKLVTRELVNCVSSISGSPYTRIRNCKWPLFHRDTPRRL